MKAFAKLLFAVTAGILPLQLVAAPPASAVPPRVAEIITTRCALCHGPEGESASAIYPRLAAQHPDYLNKQLKDFRDGRRKSDTMTDMAKDLQDEDIAALSSFFASKKAGGRQPGDVDLAGVGKYHLSARQQLFRGGGLCLMPWPEGFRHRATTASGRAASGLYRSPVEGIQQARAYQRQLDHAFDCGETYRTGNQGCLGIHRRTAIAFAAVPDSVCRGFRFAGRQAPAFVA